MSLHFQNKIVFPAPTTSYTTESAYGQVLYIPRNIMRQAHAKFALLQNGENEGEFDPQLLPSYKNERTVMVEAPDLPTPTLNHAKNTAEEERKDELPAAM